MKTRVFEKTAALLRRQHGDPLPNRTRPLLDVLVMTILSQNTSDANSLRAYRNLRKVFPSWSRLAKAQPKQVADAIRRGGLANLKSKRIVRIVSQLDGHFGRPTLEHLRKLGPERAYRELLGIEGVGPKTAACTLLFGAGFPVFPVDTHVYRVCDRLGWVGPRETRERFQERVRHLVPAKLVYPLHLNLIEHGRRVCRPKSPKCGTCSLAATCLWRKKR